MSRIRPAAPRVAVGAAVSACLAVALLLAQPLAAEAASNAAPLVVAGYASEQLANAQVIVTEAASRHLPVAAAVLGVAAAMGESGLRNLPYGDDAINPDGTVADSVGLFQQQHWWGSRAERMTPSFAADAFFAHLVRVRGWQGMTPTAAIHAVQRNADPEFYTRFVPAAIDVVGKLVEHPVRIPTSTAAPSPVPGPGTATVAEETPAPVPPAYADPHAFDELKQTWETRWDLGSADDAISSAFTDGLGVAGATLPEGSVPAP